MQGETAMSKSRFAVRSLAVTVVAGLATILPLQAASAAPDGNPLIEITREVGGIVETNQEGVVAGVIDLTRELAALLGLIVE
jgi:hypothetical protein